MDPDGNIYKAKPEDIPPEDEARLHGYLLARAEQNEKKHELALEAEKEQQALIEAVERERRRT